MKRTVILTLEYDHKESESLWTIGNNIMRILEEDMPYVKIVNIRNEPISQERNESRDDYYSSQHE